MKTLKRILIGLLLILAVGIGLLYIFGDTYILKGIRIIYLKGHTSVYIDDHNEFDNRKIEAGSPENRSRQKWPLAKNYNSVEATPKLKKTNKNLGTIAFLIIKNDSIYYEHYADSYGKDSKTNSFSMAKSITSALLGKAIKQGKIKSLEQPVADFFPQFDKRLTVGDLASMASGMDMNENYYNPFSTVAKLYLKKNVRQLMLHTKVVSPPGKKFKYLSGNAELLGMVIEKATGHNLSTYLSENFWKPMGMQNSALWELDSEESGMEKSYCCIASNARDFARFGKLYKDYGKWNGQQVLDSAFVQKSITPRFKASPQYGYGFWLSHYHGKAIFALRGILGQYVIVIPKDNLIIVRLGHKRGKFVDGKHFPSDFYTYIDEVYKLMKIK